MTIAYGTDEQHLPDCRVARGYDTHVKVYPQGVDPCSDVETWREIRVICTRHHITAIRSFETRECTGKEIAEKQHAAFDDAFVEVHEQCCAIEQDASEASL